MNFFGVSHFIVGMSYFVFITKKKLLKYINRIVIYEYKFNNGVYNIKKYILREK